MANLGGVSYTTLFRSRSQLTALCELAVNICSEGE